MSINICGTTVTTATGQIEKDSKAESILNRIQADHEERQIIRRAKEVTHTLMKDLDIPDNASIAGYLCGGVAKSNEKEITDWILRVTANSIDGSELHDPEFIHTLSIRLFSILLEIQNGHC